MKSPFLVGERIYLRRLVKEDANEKYLSWLNDPKVSQYLTVGKLPPHIDDLMRYIDGFQSNPNAAAFAIVEKAGDLHVGNATVQLINWISRSADLGLLIGDLSARGKGYPAEVWSLLVTYAFERLKLRRVYAGVVESNSENLEALRALGFKEEGRWREQSPTLQGYEDELLFGMLDHEWKSLQAGSSRRVQPPK